MQTKEYLGQISRFERMISNKMVEIEQLGTLVTSTTIPPKNANVKSTSEKDKLGNIVTEIVEKENEVNELISKRSEIIEQIDGMADFKHYDALYQKYVLKTPTKEISLDGITTVRRVQQILTEALCEFEKKYGEKYLNA